jgi:hypothetical protein
MDTALSISSPCLSMSACPAPACFRQRHLRREVIFQADPFDVPHHRPPIARHASSAAPGHHCDPHRLDNSRVRRRAAVEPTGPFTGHPASALRRSADVLPRRPRLLQPRVPQCSWARGPAQHPRRCSRIAGCDLGKCAGLHLVILSGVHNRHCMLATIVLASSAVARRCSARNRALNRSMCAVHRDTQRCVPA